MNKDLNTRNQLIASLSSGLETVKSVANIDLMALSWFLGSGVYVVTILWLTGPVRHNALNQLLVEPWFLFDTVIGLFALGATSLYAFRVAVPGLLTTKLALLSIGLISVWLGSYLIGLILPTQEPSVADKRIHCALESFFYGLPPMIVAFILTCGLYPLRPLRLMLSVSFAAGLMPVLYMQIVCLYESKHMLRFHLLPGLFAAVLGACVFLLYWWNRRVDTIR